MGPTSSEHGTEQFGMSDLLYTRDVNKTSQQEIQRPADAVRFPVSKKSAQHLNQSRLTLTTSRRARSRMMVWRLVLNSRAMAATDWP